MGAARKMMSEEEPLLAVAALKGKEEEEVEAAWKLHSAVTSYAIFLYVGIVFATLAPPVASAQRFLAGGYDLTTAVAFFAAATLLLQAWLARVLESSARARLTPLAAWRLAAVSWCGITSFFVNCLNFGDEDVGGYGECAAAAAASVANLVMTARTVRRHLA